MKASDLAALAALGVAGYAAYDKFGRKKDEDKKDEAPKLRGKLGSSKSANDDTEGEYRGNMLGQGRSANEGNAGEAEARMSKRSRQENDVPDRIMGKDAAGSRFTDRVAAEESVAKKPDADARAGFARVKAAGANSKTPKAALAASTANDDADAAAKSLSSTGGPSRARAKAVAAEASDIDSLTSQGGPSRFVRTAPTVSTATPARYNRAADSNAASNAMAASDTAGSLSSQGGPSRYRPSAVAPSAPASAAATARQRAIDERNADSDLMKGRRQAVMDTVQSIPSGIANIFKPPEREFQNKTYRNMKGDIVRYNKGGVVKKMASGGMTSSKMSSKPSTASSRGDGIAQRGKTRGQMR